MLLSSLGPLGAVGGFIQVACASGRGIDVNNYAAITEFFLKFLGISLNSSDLETVIALP